MREIGVRGLKIRASEILRNVRKKHARYIVTYHGRPMGLLMPLEQPELRESVSPGSTAWEDLTRLGREIGRRWPKGVTSTDVLSKMRR